MPVFFIEADAKEGLITYKSGHRYRLASKPITKMLFKAARLQTNIATFKIKDQAMNYEGKKLYKIEITSPGS